MYKNCILVLTSTYPRWENDTVPRFVESLCVELMKYGNHVIVLAPHFYNSKVKETLNGISVFRFKYAPERLEKLAYGGGLIYNFKHRPIVNSILLIIFLTSQFFSAISLVLKKKCSVIHAHWLVPQGFIAVLVKKVLFWKKISVVITVHGSDVHAINNKLYKILTNWIYKNADTITIVSNAIADTMKNKDKLIVASMGIDANGLLIPSQNLVKKDLLFVGRLVKQKGCDVLLNAFAEISKKYKQLNLNIVGSGPELDNLIRICIDLGIEKKVNFAGEKTQDELSKWYQSALIFVMPSVDQEGFGLVVTEAMSCECIVIASQLNSISEIIDDGVDGILVRPGSVKELSKELMRVIENPDYASHIGNNARKKVLARFDWAIIGAKYAKVISDLAT